MKSEHEASHAAFSELYDLTPSDANHNAFSHGWHSFQVYILPLVPFLLKALKAAPEEIFGYADSGYGQQWPVRDEVMADLKKAFPGHDLSGAAKPLGNDTDARLK